MVKRTVVKTFDALSVREMHEIMKLRVDVFVVEQCCAYPEIDGKDPAAFHVYISDGEVIVAYARVLAPGVSFPEASIGRVVAKRRGMHLGEEVMLAAIDVARTRFQTAGIRIEAQTYALGFYEKLGFRQVSEEFLDEGIPHIEMYLAFDDEAS